MHSIIYLEVPKTMIVNWFHCVSIECHHVLSKVLTCHTFTEYYEKLTRGEELPEAAALYVLSLHMNKSIGVLLKNGIWLMTNTSSIQENNVKFAYLGDGVFIPIEHNDPTMKLNQFLKQNTYDRKLKAMEKVNLHNHTPIRTRKHALESCHGTRSLCKKVGNKWEFKSIPMDQKQKKSTKESKGKMWNISTNIKKTISIKLDTDDLRSHETQMVKPANETSYKTSFTHSELHTIRSKYWSSIYF